MPPIFLLAVKIAFLVLLYLFVARAVRAVVVDVYGPRALGSRFTITERERIVRA